MTAYDRRCFEKRGTVFCHYLLRCSGAARQSHMPNRLQSLPLRSASDCHGRGAAAGTQR